MLRSPLALLFSSLTLGAATLDLTWGESRNDYLVDHYIPLTNVESVNYDIQPSKIFQERFPVSLPRESWEIFVEDKARECIESKDCFALAISHRLIPPQRNSGIIPQDRHAVTLGFFNRKLDAKPVISSTVAQEIYNVKHQYDNAETIQSQFGRKIWSTVKFRDIAIE